MLMKRKERAPAGAGISKGQGKYVVSMFFVVCYISGLVIFFGVTKIYFSIRFSILGEVAVYFIYFIVLLSVFGFYFKKYGSFDSMGGL